MVPKQFVAPGWAQRLPVLRAYVDETGDRGSSSNASPIFGMAAVIVDSAAEVMARTALATLRSDFHVPPTRPMSWKEDVKNHDRRVHAAQVLGAVAGLTVVYVGVEKAALREGSYRDDVTVFYNVTAYETLKRILWAARNGRSEQHQVQVRFGHVWKHDSNDTLNYFRIKHAQDRAGKVPFSHMTSLSWVAADQYEMSQVADIYAGFLKAATWPNGYGNVEGMYLTSIWHQIRNSNDCVLSLGLHYRPSSDLVRAKPWWPCKECTSRF
jgi:hypothetical protein